MGDSVQQQLDRLLTLFLEEQAANRAHRDEMNSKIEALSMAGSGSPHSHHTKHTDHASGSGGHGLVPRFAKLDFPKFNGFDDPLGWLSCCEHFFRHQLTAEEDKVSLASYHLDGNAQLWFLQLLDDCPDPSWEEFKRQCNLRFGPPIRSNKFGELAKLKQTGTVSDYQTQFEILVSRAGRLSQLQKVQLYISGLRDDIAVEVELHHPADLVTAMSVSRLYERRCTDVALDAAAAASTTTNTTGRTIKRLTHEEMMDRRRKGLCFNCDEPFIRGHQCTKLFWIEVKDAEPPTETRSSALEDKCQFKGGVMLRAS